MMHVVLLDVAQTAAHYFKTDIETYSACKDNWAETVLDKLGPEGCLQIIKDHYETRGLLWNQDSEDNYRNEGTLKLSRSAMFSLVLQILYPQPGDMLVA